MDHRCPLRAGAARHGCAGRGGRCSRDAEPSPGVTFTALPAGSVARLAGRTAIVTGSTSGIGAATARALAAAGAHVLVSGRDAKRGDYIAGEIQAAGGHADILAVDLGGSYHELRAFAGSAAATLGGHVDILVNNSGIYLATATGACRMPTSTPCSPSTSGPRTCWCRPWPDAAAERW